MFDRNNPVTLIGTVKAFEWTNPHSHLVLVAKEVRNRKGERENSQQEEWRVELHSTAILLRRGWTITFFKPGDTITVNGGRMLDGSKMMRLDDGVKADGSKFYGDDFRPSTSRKIQISRSPNTTVTGCSTIVRTHRKSKNGS